MPKPKHRSQSVKAKKKKGKRTLYKRKKGKKVSCGVCHGLVKKTGSNKPIRIAGKFGANLCTKCSRIIKSYAGRVKNGKMKLDSMKLAYQKYVSILVK